MAKILIVEDSPDLGPQLCTWLTNEGQICELAGTGEDAVQLLINFSYDIVLLDWQLPGMSGLDVCRKFRQMGGESFVIFLTGKSDIDSKEQALNLGADDYLTKPFEFRELFARIKTMLRRPAGLLKEELVIGQVALDVKSRIVSTPAKSVQLMPKESALLEFLMRHPNRTFGAKDLLKSVWPSECDTGADTVRSWMLKLRSKLAQIESESLVKTVSRSGYMIELLDQD